MKTYLEISISCSEGQREMLIPTLSELGCMGFQETDAELLCYFDQSPLPPAQRENLKRDLARLLQTLSSNADIRWRDLPEADWNAEWEQSLKPVEVGARLVVMPSWCRYTNAQNRISIIIDPKMSFGTAYHETTRMMLLLLERHVAEGVTVLDVGTGTGVLAIAAVKLGAASAEGIDIDEWALINATENVARNHVEARVRIGSRSIAEIGESSVGLLCANLTLNLNLEYLDLFRRALIPGGVLLLSGMLGEDRQQLAQGLRRSRLRTIEEQSENEWIALAVTAGS